MENMLLNRCKSGACCVGTGVCRGRQNLKYHNQQTTMCAGGGRPTTFKETTGALRRCLYACMVCYGRPDSWILLICKMKFEYYNFLHLRYTQRVIGRLGALPGMPHFICGSLALPASVSPVPSLSVAHLHWIDVLTPTRAQFLFIYFFTIVPVTLLCALWWRRQQKWLHRVA